MDHHNTDFTPEFAIGDAATTDFNSSSPRKCPLEDSRCRSSYGTADELAYHLTCYHGHMTMLYCQNCKMIFANSLRHGQSELCRASTKVWICLSCRTYFNNASKLALHVFSSPCHQGIDLSVELRSSNSTSRNQRDQFQLTGKIDEKAKAPQRANSEGIDDIDDKSITKQMPHENHAISESVIYEEGSEDDNGIKDEQEDGPGAVQEQEKHNENQMKDILDEGYREIHQQKRPDQNLGDEENDKLPSKVVLSILAVRHILIIASSHRGSP